MVSHVSTTSFASQNVAARKPFCVLPQANSKLKIEQDAQFSAILIIVSFPPRTAAKALDNGDLLKANLQAKELTRT